MAQRIESKVTAGSLAAGAAGAAVYVLQTYVFHGSAVPDGLVALVYLAVPAVLAAAAGYLAPHTNRPGAVADALPPPSNVVVTPAPPAPAEPQPPGATPPPEPPRMNEH